MKRLKSVNHCVRHTRSMGLALAVLALAVPTSTRAQIPAQWITPGDGAWDAPANWSLGGGFPNNGSPTLGDFYDVTLGQTAGLYEVTLDQPIELNSLQFSPLYTTLSLLPGSELSVQQPVDITGVTVNIDHGTIRDTTITGDGVLVAQYEFGNTGPFAVNLDGVTLGADLLVETDDIYKRLRVVNGLTLDHGTIDFRKFGSLTLEGDQTIGGTGTIRYRDGNSRLAILATGTAVIGPDVVVDVAQYGINFFEGAGHVINRGTVRAGSGWNLSSSIIVSVDNFTNEGTVRLEGPQGLMELRNNWSNAAGMIVVYGGQVILNDDYTYSDIGGIRWMDPAFGSIRYRGSLDHQGQDLVFDDTMGLIEFGADLVGGRVVSAGSRPVVLYGGLQQDTAFGGEFAFFSSTFSGDIYFEEGTVLRSTTVEGAFGSGGDLRTEGDTKLGGSAEIIFDKGHGATTEIQDPDSSIRSNNGTLTIGPDITIRTGTGGGTISGSTVIHQGTLLIETPGHQVRVGGAWQNEGTIHLSDGLLVLADEWEHSVIDSIHQTGGHIMIGWMMDNTGSSVILDQPTQAWGLKDRTITGGRLDVSNGASFLLLNGNIDQTTLTGDITVQDGNFDGVMFDGADVYLEQVYPERHPGSLMIMDGVLAGTGQVIFNDDEHESRLWIFSEDPFVIESGITVRTGSGSGIISAAVTNRGTIHAESPRTYLKLDGDWVNEGELIIGDGLLLLGGNTTPQDIGRVSRQGSGHIVLVGQMDLSMGPLDLADFDGDLSLSTGGRLHGGTITASSGQRLVIPDIDTNTYRGNITGDIYLEDLVLDTDLYVDIQKKVVLKGQITLNEGRFIRLGSTPEDGGRAVLEFKSGSSLVGGGEVIFDATLNGLVHHIELAEQGEGVTIRTGTGDGLVYRSFGGNLNGTILADQPGRSIELFGAYHYYGSSIASGGGKLTFSSGDWINQPGALIHAQAGGLIEVLDDDVDNHGQVIAENGEIRLHNETFDNFTGGVVRATANGVITGSADTLNEGLIEVDHGGSFILTTGRFTNGSTGVVTAGQGGIVLLHQFVSNDGVLEIDGGVMRLRPRSFFMTQSQVGTVTRSGGSLYFDGHYKNSGGVLDMDGPLGQITLDHEDARISEGDIIGSAGTPLLVVRGAVNAAHVFSDVHIVDELVLSGRNTLTQSALLAQDSGALVRVQGEAFFEAGHIGAPFQIDAAGHLHIDPATTFQPGSSIHLNAFASLTIQGHSLLDDMTIGINGSGSRIRFDGGDLILGPTLKIEADGGGEPDLVATSGRLTNYGEITVNADVFRIIPQRLLNYGTLEVTDPQARLTINGPWNNYGLVSLVIGDEGQDFAPLRFVSVADLEGDLAVHLDEDFVPATGSTFTLLEAGVLRGSFDSVSLPDTSPGTGWRINYTDTHMSLTLSQISDVNGDGFVDIEDLNIVLANWNQNVPPGDPLADPSGDGYVGIVDLNTVLSNWNAGTPPTVSASIPEPASLGLLLFGSTVMMRRMN